MILRNLKFRATQYTRENRDKLIRWGLITIAVVILILLLLGGIASWEDRRLKKEMQKWEQKYRDADARAKEAEQQAAALKNAIEGKYDEINAIRERAETAEHALRNAKTKTITLKEQYETIRYLPVPNSVSCAELRAELAGLGFK